MIRLQDYLVDFKEVNIGVPIFFWRLMKGQAFPLEISVKDLVDKTSIQFVPSAQPKPYTKILTEALKKEGS
jgi:hypothetical protein